MVTELQPEKPVTIPRGYPLGMKVGHPQVKIKTPAGHIIEVDKLMADFLPFLWQRKIISEWSCQGEPFGKKKKPEPAYIVILQKKNVKLFLSHVTDCFPEAVFLDDQKPVKWKKQFETQPFFATTGSWFPRKENPKGYRGVFRFSQNTLLTFTDYFKTATLLQSPLNKKAKEAFELVSQRIKEDELRQNVENS